jgi:multimeric flavodoxin WrbA
MQASKVVILQGSPRLNANSTILADKMAQGIKEAGGEVDSFYLHGMEVGPCDACDACQGVPGLDCVVEDDMHQIYPKLRDAQAIVFASPVYWGSVSAQLKLALDRCYGLEPVGGADGAHVFDGKRIGIILTYAGDDLYHSGAISCVRMFEDSFRYHPAEIVGIVHGQCDMPGEISANEALMQKSYDLGKELIA